MKGWWKMLNGETKRMSADYPNRVTMPSPIFDLIALKDRQCRKIRQLKDALVESGFTALDEQALALGLSRSSTWALLRGTHKASGLSAAIISRMLNSPLLPPLARATIVEYIEEKAS